jgi:hypothetical protein
MYFPKTRVQSKCLGRNGKSQVTIIIIICIIILIAVLGLIYVINLTKEKKVEDDVMLTQKIPQELEPYVNYMQTCLEKLAKKAIFLSGKQGGLIYVSQGGKSPDYPDYLEGQIYMPYRSTNIPYLIGKPVAGDGCKNSLPDYPSFNPYYPYGSSLDLSDPAYLTTIEYEAKDCFGRFETGFMRQNTFRDIQEYIRTRVNIECNASDSFLNYKFDFSEPDVQIKSKTSSTFFEIRYPINITNRQTNAKTYLRIFTVDLKFRFEELYAFVNNIADLDVSDPTYDIGKGNQVGFRTYVTRDAFNQDDIITVESDLLILDAEKYQYVFARKNRYPVLEYVYNTSFRMIPFVEGQVISWDSVIHQQLRAVDPDEDNATIRALLGEGIIQKELTKENPYTITFQDVDYVGRIKINITASDGQYADYQVRNKEEEFIIP